MLKWFVFLALPAAGCMLTGAEVSDKVDEVDEADDEIVISSVSPDSGSIDGGTSVTIGAEPLDRDPLVYFIDDANEYEAAVTDWADNGVIVVTPKFATGGYKDIRIWAGTLYGEAVDAFYVNP